MVKLEKVKNENARGRCNLNQANPVTKRIERSAVRLSFTGSRFDIESERVVVRQSLRGPRGLFGRLDHLVLDGWKPDLRRGHIRRPELTRPGGTGVGQRWDRG